MSIIDIWKAYVKAKDALTKQYSEPFKIKFVNIDNAGVGQFQIQQIDPLNKILPKLKKVFPGITTEDVYLEQGYLLHDAEQPVNDTQHLKEFAEANYYDFSPKPCFSGEVCLNEPPYSWIKKITERYPNADGDILATLPEIQAIDQALHERPRFSRESLIGAILKVSPSEKYIKGQHLKLFQFLKNNVRLDVIPTKEDYSQISIKNTLLKSQFLNYLQSKFVSLLSYHSIVFEIEEDAFNEFLKTRLERNIFFASEDGQDITYGVVLPTPKNNKFVININEELSLQDLQYEIFYFQKVFERYFQREHINISYYNEIVLLNRINEDAFFRELKQWAPESQYNVSYAARTIAFDFQNEEELNAGIQELRNIQIADIDYHQHDHRYKVTIKYESPLLDVQRELASIPSVTSKIATDQQKLTFFCSFDNQELSYLLQNRVTDKLQETIPQNASYRFHELQDGRLKYHLSFNESDYLNDLQKKFEYLNGEVVLIHNAERKEIFGSIVRINFPYLDIQLESNIDQSVYDDECLKVSCELRGERDKIKRLSDTVDIIFSEKTPDIPNTRLPDILTNSRKANTIEGDILRSQDYFQIKENVGNHLLSSNINEKQLEGVCKSLLAEELFMIQGPPGTGKSTAISELIWQHIRKNREENKQDFRVLVSSETNLAVDNALEKLKSKTHMLIKPIRFGSEDKIDKGGRQYFLEQLTKWGNHDLNLPDESVPQYNILDDWVNQVKFRSERSETAVNQDVLKRWRKVLSNKTSLIRSTFYKNYLANVNVIGATCSSIGVSNSKGHLTNFFLEYCQVFHSKKYERFKNSPGRNTAADLKKNNISFDLVVQDEASKASPPELALPCLFGKKAIVIGDHRQLPPMVDTNEFLDNLQQIRKKSDDPDYRRELNKLIQYVKENGDTFKKSHFETLFSNINKNLRTSFNIQYRMHPGINEIVKQFYTYDSGLKCGIPEDDANSPHLTNPMSRYHGVTKTQNTHVVWIDTRSPEIKKGTSRYNPGEMENIDWLLDRIYQHPGYKKFIDFWPEDLIDEKQIGIITFYGAQAGELNKLHDKYPNMPLRISPVDRFQGMERNIVIVSLVRSNRIAEIPNQPPNYEDFGEMGYPKQESLGFAEIPNRLNVALSRAKRLLVIVGNSEHFKQNPIYDNVYKTIHDSQYGCIM